MATMVAHDETFFRLTEVAHGVVREQAVTVDAESKWPRTGLRALQEAGLGGLVVPSGSGGLGQGLFSLARACEVLGKECSSTALCFGMHCVGAAVIASKATPGQSSEFLEPIAAGKHLTTLALSETASGSHFYFPQTELEDLGAGGYRIKGEKSFVTSGGHADSYVVSTSSKDTGAQLGEFSCIVVRRKDAGVSWQGNWDGIGMRGNSSIRAVFADTRVPTDRLLGAPGDQIWFIFQVVAPYFLMAMAGTYLGIATAALEQTLEHLGKRVYTHGGRSPAHSSVVQRELGILWRRVESTRRLVYHAAQMGDAGDDSALAALCSAKADVAECANFAVDRAMTLCGGIAYRDSSRLERLLRDARAAHVMAPTTTLLETWTGRALLGIPLLTEST